MIDWDAILIRLKDHPVFVVLGFCSAVVLPFVGLFANVLSPGWAISASVGYGFALLGILFWPAAQPQPNMDAPPSPTPPTPTAQNENANNASRCQHVRKAIQRQFVAGYGDKGRLEYFLQRVKGQDHRDSYYREAMDSLKDDPHWAVVSAGVDEWITIGFNSIAEWNSAWNNSGTLNQLYIAAYNTLLREDELRFEYGRGMDYAQAVSAIVAARRRAAL